MKTPTWLTRDLLLAIHDRQTAEHGGPAGVRDEAALQAVVDRPVDRLKRQPTSLMRLAGLYAVGLCLDRPFHAGNGRAAVVAFETFLSINGMPTTRSDLELFDAIGKLRTGWTEADFLNWLDHPAGPMTGTPPNRRTAMTTEYLCPRCGGSLGEPGSVHSTGRLYFRPTNARFLTLKTGDIEVKANACSTCGHVDLVADPDKLTALTRRAQPV